MDPVEELIDDLNNAAEEVKNAASEPDEPAMEAEAESDTDSKKQELTQSSEDGEIDQSVKYLKNASEKAINKLYSQLEAKHIHH